MLDCPNSLMLNFNQPNIWFLFNLRDNGLKVSHFYYEWQCDLDPGLKLNVLGDYDTCLIIHFIYNDIKRSFFSHLSLISL